MSALDADRSQIERFVNAMFIHADEGTFASLRTFTHNAGDPPVDVRGVEINGVGLEPLVQIAFGKASRAARHPKPVVFCPPVCTLNNATRAREEDLANGLALSVEIDADARDGLTLLRGLIGQPTVVVASGGEWINPAGEVQPKLHGHWRLSEPTRTAEEHGKLKAARRLATALVGGDATNIPVVHPIRWPGSVHRKGQPKLARIVGFHPDAEIDLGEALEALEAAAKAHGISFDTGHGGTGEQRDTAALIAEIMSARAYVAPLTALSARYAGGGMTKPKIVETLEGLMLAVPVEIRDRGQPGRWQSRFDGIPRMAASAVLKFGPQAEQAQAWRTEPDFRRPSLGPRPEDTHWEEADPHAAGRTEARDKQERAKDNGLDKSEAVILDPTDPYKSAAVFLERHCSHKDGRTLQRHRGSFYAYTGTHYREMQAEEIRKVLYQFLDSAQVWRTAGKKAKGEEPTFELAPFKPNRNHVHDLVDTVQARAGIDDQLAMPCWLGRADPQGTVIPMANGLLELATGKLLPHSPRYFQSYSLSFDYAPKAPGPTEWLRFLASLWPGDDEARDTLQEIMGLLLTDDTSHHKLFMLVGPPRSGKGTIARVLQLMHGKENVAGPTLSSLALNFGLQELIGKPVAVISDARLSGRSDAAVIAERLLSISGEDCLTIDRKHRDPWTGTLPTRFLILTNELPRIADSSGALASRFVILMLTRSFLGKEDHQLLAKLVPELSGIFNWALAGRARVEQRGYFVMPKSSQEAVEEIIALSSPIRAFIRDCCVIAPAAEEKVSVMYAQWRAWCGDQGRDRPGTVQAFGTALRSALPHLRVAQHRDPPDDKLDRYYLGVRLRKEADS